MHETRWGPKDYSNKYLVRAFAFRVEWRLRRIQFDVLNFRYWPGGASGVGGDRQCVLRTPSRPWRMTVTGQGNRELKNAYGQTGAALELNSAMPGQPVSEPIKG
jgi:hypothetical protein